MSSPDVEVQPVAEQGPIYWFSEQIRLTSANTTDGQVKREFDFITKINGPATFIRLVATNDCRLFYWDPADNSWEEFYEGTVLNRGLIANIPLRVTNENWHKILVQGPVNTTISIYASRKPNVV